MISLIYHYCARPIWKFHPTDFWGFPLQDMDFVIILYEGGSRFVNATPPTPLTEIHSDFHRISLIYHFCAPPIWNFHPTNFWGFPLQDRDFVYNTIWSRYRFVNATPPTTLTEIQWNFHRILLIYHYCALPIWNFHPTNFWGFPLKDRDIVIILYEGGTRFVNATSPTPLTEFTKLSLNFT